MRPLPQKGHLVGAIARVALPAFRVAALSVLAALGFLAATSQRAATAAPIAAAFAEAPPPSPPLPSVGPAARRAEFDQAWNEIGGGEMGAIGNYDEDGYREARARALTLIEEWAADSATAHCDGGAAAVLADLADLATEPADPKAPTGKPQQRFSASAVPLPPAAGRPPAIAVSIDAGFVGGTVFVIAPRETATDPWRVAWSIRPLADANFPLQNELGWWAYTIPAYHDGPPAGSVEALPPTRGGRPRFLVHAIAQASAGMDVPAQIGVWEWTGERAVPELLRSYFTTYNIDRQTRRGDRIRLATKEAPKTFYSCGSCDDPQGVWTLRLDPDAVTDLGHRFNEPILQTADQLLVRVASGGDATALAAPAAIATLRHWAADLRADLAPPAAAEGAGNDSKGGESGGGQSGESGGGGDGDGALVAPDPLRGIASMLEAWHVTRRGGRRILDIATDNWHLRLTFERRGGGFYATAAHILTVS